MAEDRIELQRLEEAKEAYAEVLEAIASTGAFVREVSGNLDYFDKRRAQERLISIIRRLAKMDTKELGRDDLYQKDALKKVGLARESEEYKETAKRVRNKQTPSAIARENFNAINWLHEQLFEPIETPVSVRGILQKSG